HVLIISHLLQPVFPPSRQVSGSPTSSSNSLVGYLVLLQRQDTVGSFRSSSQVRAYRPNYAR
ncbi:hypothetical protein CCUS01_00002, partial [Colletotrichum cuscutae]